MRIYCTRTQEDYNSLMVELEKQGLEWFGKYKPTSQDYWSKNKENTCILIIYKYISCGPIEWHEEAYPLVPIVEYKADKKEETDDFIKELTVKIYYNEITKKHYNSYEDAIADCKKEMEHQHDNN